MRFVRLGSCSLFQEDSDGGKRGLFRQATRLFVHSLTRSQDMRPQVLQQELFQLTERIKQIDYKIAKQKDPQSREMLAKKRDGHAKTRQHLKMVLQVIYDNQTRNQQCSVA